MTKPVTIIVPVYGDWDSLQKNIAALKETLPYFSPHTVLFVNDCGPEADLFEQRIKQLIRFRRNFRYHRNEFNIGFGRTCNNAVFNLARKSDDVLLLNSDAVVTPGFLEEMQRVLYSSDRVGAVCPRSNAATIFSVPMMPEPGRDLSMEESYQIYQKIRLALPQYYYSPIAHGFCIMIRREVINKFGLFDEIYDMGYGEENDFCMRIRRKGWTCAVANRAFVFHYNARSFSLDRKTKLIETNEKVLDARYPEYRSLVVDYIHSVRFENWAK